MRYDNDIVKKLEVQMIPVTTGTAQGLLTFAGEREKWPGDGSSRSVIVKIGPWSAQLCRGTKKSLRGAVTLSDGFKKMANGQANVAGEIQKIAEGREKIARGEEKFANGSKNTAAAIKKMANGRVRIADWDREIAGGQVALADGRVTNSRGARPARVIGKYSQRMKPEMENEYFSAAARLNRVEQHHQIRVSETNRQTAKNNTILTLIATTSQSSLSMHREGEEGEFLNRLYRNSATTRSSCVEVYQTGNSTETADQLAAHSSRLSAQNIKPANVSLCTGKRTVANNKNHHAYAT
ncbi:hypothetical protein [Maribellus sp. YY47]|uniref:hypothetical protein n=1 Tax=Maribellus sp. YY47 TaxID=2929486 RepID=UPI002000A6F1|nr:hypothetical protein [Maribellus sp. YY47]MCK3685485.1 hypothetical protein [Maribellus sp. YY47]